MDSIGILKPPFSPTSSPLQYSVSEKEMKGYLVGDEKSTASSRSTMTSMKYPSSMDALSFIEQELDVSRLNDIHAHLWWAGRPSNYRPLWRQMTMQRNIILTEQTDLHLVWHESWIFMKPLPAFLLDYDFFSNHLCSRQTFPGSDSSLYGRACGLLLSYTKLICYPSDLKLAIKLGLVPPDIVWERWASFVHEFREKIDVCALDRVNKRYIYGELRLARLNMIYRLSGRDFLRGYFRTYTNYNIFFQKNFAWILPAFFYITILLQAMQVSLTTPHGLSNGLFTRATYGFGLTSIMVVVVTMTLILIIFLTLFVYSLLVTLSYNRKTEAERQKLIRLNAESV